MTNAGALRDSVRRSPVDGAGSAPDEPVLAVGAVRKSYGGTPVLHGVDLEIRAGEITGLIGLNGAGKSTLVSIIAGLRRPDAGSVRVAGVNVLRYPWRARRHLGLAPQDLGVYPTVTVQENLLFFGELAGLRGAALRTRIDEVGGALELTGLFDRRAKQLSGGEKRRLHTAAALLHRPPLLLLDEPTVGVDVATRSQLLQVIRDLADQGAAVCYSTHYLAELEVLRSSVAVLHGGRIVERGPLDKLITAHGSSAVELAFDGPVPDGVDLGTGATVRGDQVSVRTDDPTRTVAEVLSRLDGHTGALRSINLVRPNLETAFMTLTGARIDERADGGAEPGRE